MGLDFLSAIGGLGKGAMLINYDQRQQAAEQRANEAMQIQKDEAGRRKQEFDRRDAYLSDVGNIVAKYGQSFATPGTANSPSAPAASGPTAVDDGAAQGATADSAASPVATSAAQLGAIPSSGNPFSGLSSYYGKMPVGKRAQMQSEMLASAVKHGQIELPHYQQAMQQLDALHKTGTLDALNMALQGSDMASVEKALAESGIRVKPGSLSMQPVANGGYDLPDTLFSMTGDDGQQYSLSLNQVSAAALSSKDRLEFLTKQQQTRALEEYRRAQIDQRDTASILRYVLGGGKAATASGGAGINGGGVGAAGVKQSDFFKNMTGEDGKADPNAPHGWTNYQRIIAAASPEQRSSGAFDAMAQMVAMEVARGQRNISAEIMPDGSWAEVIKMPNGQQIVLEDSRSNRVGIDPTSLLNRNEVPVLLPESANRGFSATAANRKELADRAQRAQVDTERSALQGFRDKDPAGYTTFYKVAQDAPVYDALRAKVVNGGASEKERITYNYASMIRRVNNYAEQWKKKPEAEKGGQRMAPDNGLNADQFALPY